MQSPKARTEREINSESVSDVPQNESSKRTLEQDSPAKVVEKPGKKKSRNTSNLLHANAIKPLIKISTSLSDTKFQIPSQNSAQSSQNQFLPNSGYRRTAGIPSPISGGNGYTQSQILHKSAFMELFSQFYDQIDETAKLNLALKEQMRKSTVQLQMLQGSGQMIEGLVKGQFKQMQNEHQAQLNPVFTDLDFRLTSIEKVLGITHDAASNSATSSEDLYDDHPTMVDVVGKIPRHL